MGAEPARRPLAETAAKRTLEAEQRVRSALRELDRDGATVTFAAVAERARVSRAFLYQHAQLRSQIEALRAAARCRVRRACRFASAPVTRRCAPGCAPRWMRASASARSSPGCVRSSRSRTAACGSWSSTDACAARDLHGVFPGACAAQPIGAGGGPGADHLRQRGDRLHDRAGRDRADRAGSADGRRAAAGRPDRRKPAL